MTATQITTLTGILLLATVTEALVEYLIKPWLNLAQHPDAAPDPKMEATLDLVTRTSAALTGILLCFAYRADLLALAGLSCPWPPLGSIITGILAGRGSNFLHDFAGRWLRA